MGSAAAVVISASTSFMSFFAGRKKLEFLLENQGRLSWWPGTRDGPVTSGGKNEKKAGAKRYEWKEGVVVVVVGGPPRWSDERRTGEIGTNFVASFCKAKGIYGTEYINEAACFDARRPRRVIFNY